LILLTASGAFAISAELVSNDWATFPLAGDLGMSVGFPGIGFVEFASAITIDRFSGDMLQLRFSRE
jgi:hypothetical protein